MSRPLAWLEANQVALYLGGIAVGAAAGILAPAAAPAASIATTPALALLLFATPALMLLQFALLPLYLALFGAGELAADLDPRPFVDAFVFIIAVPLAAAWAVQAAARARAVRVRRPAERISRGANAAMVPLMVLVLAVVVASQIAGIGVSAVELLRLVPLYAAFLIAMVVVGLGATRIARLDARSARAVVFSGATRNSLVVLPLALALPVGFELAPLAVVTQTLVELVGMIVLVKLVPALLPVRGRPIA
ncbi:hypothetical protein ET445_12625 [Agromyces protaetiae]|uniref:Arsenic resistance protein n=1 Tax=Agromyces protaetiae TaxID=2509455 RepID=A0A4P6FE48_9MICO|nr:hypothetical protein [Agromyces protaetiae]QAY74056.1 hypothetical protein ET445_12625 [Agromyces protaetiae]